MTAPANPSNPSNPDLSPGEPAAEPRPMGYRVLTAFPFLFLPIAALVAVLLAIIMPWLTGVGGF
jgi:hypothetical protein